MPPPALRRRTSPTVEESRARSTSSRIISSFVSLALLLVLVFFLSRLTGDPAELFLPIDADAGVRDQFRELHGFNHPHHRAVRPLRLGRAAPRLRPLAAPGAAGASMSCCRLSLDALARAITTIVLVSIAAIVIGSLAAFRPGGLFDRLVTLISLIGARRPTSGSRSSASSSSPWPRMAADLRHGDGRHWILPIAVLFLRPFGLLLQVVRGSMVQAFRLRLRQDGAGQGRRQPHDHLRPCAAQRHAAGHHRRRRPGGRHGQRRGGRRDHLRLPGHRQADDRLDPARATSP